MKTLSEQINEVLTSKQSKSAKRNDLIKKLGLTQLDVRVLFKTYADVIEQTSTTHTRAPRITGERAATINALAMKYTFGVEIECYNAPRQTLMQALAANNLRAQNRENYCDAHTGSYRRAYRLVHDGSIEGCNAVECVTPILKGNRGFNSLQACCKALNTVGARVNTSTGLHIHVGGEITEKQYCNTFANYYYLESVIDSFMAASRRDTFYSHSLHGHVNAYNLLSARTFGEVYNVFQSRYYKLNACSWARHQTIEFRQHSGTTNFEKIQMWAKFCLKLVAWSADHRLTADVRTINDIPFLTKAEKDWFTNRANTLSGAAE